MAFFVPLLAGAIALLAIFARKLLSRRVRLPPGPKGLPIIGNLFDMPREYEWRTFGHWGEKYGPIIGLNLLGQPIVVINSLNLAGELLHKRGNVYSDRPPMVMAGQLVGWEGSMILLPYGERFREYRKLVQRGMGGAKAVLDWTSEFQEAEARRFLQRIMRDSDSRSLQKHITRTTGAIILKVTYGYDVREEDDPLVDHADSVMETFTKVTTPGAFIVDVFPLLRYLPEWFPGAGFRRSARIWKRELLDMVNVPHQHAKRQMEEGKDATSYVAKLLLNESLDPEGFKEDLIKWSAFSLFAGGADTTVSSLHSFFLAMTIYQDVQRRARAELDAVVGPDRLPTLEDRPNLPYLNALVTEVLRWIPVGPLAVPHRVTEDDVVDGYDIPKGTIVIPNIWQMLHDPAVYARPDEFDPTRFMATKDKPADPDPRDTCFGFGRRLCPGAHLADQSLFITCAMVLAAFEINQVVDEHGRAVVPKVAYKSGTIWYARPNFSTALDDDYAFKSPETVPV